MNYSYKISIFISSSILSGCFWIGIEVSVFGSISFFHVEILEFLYDEIDTDRAVF